MLTFSLVVSDQLRQLKSQPFSRLGRGRNDAKEREGESLCIINLYGSETSLHCLYYDETLSNWVCYLIIL